MLQLKGRGAFVTGAANGIGRGIARAFAGAGADLVLADIDAAGLQPVQEELCAMGVRVHTMALDVSDRAAVQRAATQAEAWLGRVHVVVNNAGVSLGVVPLVEVEDAQWDWILGVNLRGVINGIAAFLPQLRAHGEPAHIVNTASIGGMQVNPILRNGSYCATKFAVVAVSETLALEVEGSSIGVSVLCPAFVPTSLRQSAERRPARFGGPYAPPPAADQRARLSTGAAVDPDFVGRRVVRAIQQREFYVFTHPYTRAWLAERHGRVEEGFDQLDAFLEAEQSRPA